MSAAAMIDQDGQFSRIIAEEGSRLRNFIRKRVANDADADDLLQEVFFEVVEALRIGEPVTQWSAWMFRVARNRIVDMFRRKSRWKIAEDPEFAGEAEVSLLDSLPSPDASPAEAYFRAALLEEIEAALDELPSEQRAVFIAHEIDGLSFKEIAAQTGIGINTLLSRKHYAVQALRRRLEPLYREFIGTGEQS